MNNGFSSNDEEVHEKQPLEICCLVEDGIRCKNIAGNASYSKRIQKTVTQRKLKLTIDSLARHIYICDQHKAKIQCARTKRRRKDSDDDTETDTADVPEVDLYSLQVNTLRRYKKFYKVSTKPGLNKAQLAESIMKHFKTISIKEKKDIVTYFIYMVKTNSNKIDQKNGITNTMGDL